MSELTVNAVDELDPEDAWNVLSVTPGAVLVDVRSKAEQVADGMPDLGGLGARVITAEWRRWPAMECNPGFIGGLEAKLATDPPARLFFICRTGGRARAAAHAFAAHMKTRAQDLHITTITEGFDGSADAEGRRGETDGWKAAGLPWTPV